MSTAAQERSTASPLVAQLLAVDSIDFSRTNPRKHFDEAALEEMAESMRKLGVLEPVLVRPHQGRYELVAGERRLRAAKKAGIETVPATIRELTDVEVLEIQIVENLQRSDLHPLEEAAGYQALIRSAKYDVQRIADRVGRSIKYVYDRVKLLALTKEAQEQFAGGKMTAGHAILLARLKPEEQKLALETDGALFEYEDGLFTPEEEDELDKRRARDYRGEVKPRSVREFAGWIDQRIKLDHQAADPMLFPEVVGSVKAAQAASERIVRITHETITPLEVRDDGGPKVVLGNSWERADGQYKSKTCDYAVTGVIVIGPGRGQAFKVCVAKDKCGVHWESRIRDKRSRETETAKAGKAGKTATERQDLERKKRQEEQARRDAEAARWRKATPAICEALARAVKKAPTKLDGPVGKLAVEILQQELYGSVAAAKYLPIGKTPDDLVRHMAFLTLQGEIEYGDQAEFIKDAKAIGVDVAKILDDVAPVGKAATPAKSAKVTARSKRKK